RGPPRPPIFPYTTLFRSLERRPRPVDASVLGPAAPEILPGLDGLGPARRRAGDEARERARQHDLGGDRDLGEHLAGIVAGTAPRDRKSTRLNSSHLVISY